MTPRAPRPAGRNGGHGNTPTARCQAKRAVFLALQEVGARGGTREEIYRRALVHRPQLGERDLTRVLRRGLRDVWICSLEFGRFALIAHYRPPAPRSVSS